METTSHYIIVGTSPDNGSVVEIIAGRDTSVSCEFTIPLENEVIGTVKWFLNEVEVNFGEEAQFQGVLFSEMISGSRQGGVRVVHSTLTVLTSVETSPLVLNNGKISCSLDSNLNLFGLFITVLPPRTG